MSEFSGICPNEGVSSRMGPGEALDDHLKDSACLINHSYVVGNVDDFEYSGGGSIFGFECDDTGRNRFVEPACDHHLNFFARDHNGKSTTNDRWREDVDTKTFAGKEFPGTPFLGTESKSSEDVSDRLTTPVLSSNLYQSHSISDSSFGAQCWEKELNGCHSKGSVRGNRCVGNKEKQKRSTNVRSTKFNRTPSISEVFELAERQFLDAQVILKLLYAGKVRRLPVLKKLQLRPHSGCLFLYDRHLLPLFRADGHNWVRKRGSQSVREDHVKLKVGKGHRVYAAHVHSAENNTFHRRCYWDMASDRSIVLVHYLATNTESVSSRHAEECNCLKCRVGTREPYTAIVNTVMMESVARLDALDLRPCLSDETVDKTPLANRSSTNRIAIKSSDFVKLSPETPKNAEFVVEDFCPDKVDPGSKILITLTRNSTESLAQCQIAHKVGQVEVDFGTTTGVPAQFLRSGAIRCYAPDFSTGAVVPLSVRIDGKLCAVNPSLKFSVGYRLKREQPGETFRKILKRKLVCNKTESLCGFERGEYRQYGMKSEINDLESLSDDDLGSLCETFLERVVCALLHVSSVETELYGELDTLDGSGFSLLHYTILFSHVRLATLLLNNGANPNVLTSTGDSSLHLAAEVGDVEIAKKLLEAGANLNQLDSSGLSCVDIAKRHDHRVFEWFRKQHEMRTYGVNLKETKASIQTFNDCDCRVDGCDIERLDCSKRTKMVRAAVDSLSLKEKCALTLSSTYKERKKKSQNVEGKQNTNDCKDDTQKEVNQGALLLGNTCNSVVTSQLLTPMISVMGAEERDELENEARKIEKSFGRWILARNLRTARRVQHEADGFLTEKDRDNCSQIKAKRRFPEKCLEDNTTKDQTHSNVVQLQAVARGMLARKKFRVWRGEVAAAIVIQRCIRARKKISGDR